MRNSINWFQVQTEKNVSYTKKAARFYSGCLCHHYLFS